MYCARSPCGPDRAAEDEDEQPGQHDRHQQRVGHRRRVLPDLEEVAAGQRAGVPHRGPQAYPRLVEERGGRCGAGQGLRGRHGFSSAQTRLRRSSSHFCQYVRRSLSGWATMMSPRTAEPLIRTSGVMASGPAVLPGQIAQIAEDLAAIHLDPDAFRQQQVHIADERAGLDGQLAGGRCRGGAQVEGQIPEDRGRRDAVLQHGAVVDEVAEGGAEGALSGGGPCRGGGCHVRQILADGHQLGVGTGQIGRLGALGQLLQGQAALGGGLAEPFDHGLALGVRGQHRGRRGVRGRHILVQIGALGLRHLWCLRGVRRWWGACGLIRPRRRGGVHRRAVVHRKVDPGRRRTQFGVPGGRFSVLCTGLS